ncbi:MAG: sigma 54-interacting transcriptional regulator [Myxococcales bacterium]|nr:sigma 54-interacting transcriptional regulator [Myxococcales bacterium]
MAEESEPTSSEGADGAWSLTVVHAPRAELVGRVYPIGEGICVGRVAQEGVDVALDDRLLSGRHATIRRLADGGRGGGDAGWTVHELVDHGSRNGSFVDGVRVERSHLSDGAILRLGVTLLELSRAKYDEPPPSVPASVRGDLVGRSAGFRSVMQALAEARKGHAPVVITGEAGSGKTALASALHAQTALEAPLVTVGCGGGSQLKLRDLVGGDGAEGYFEAAQGGTLVFDEIDLLAPELQGEVLRILETGKLPGDRSLEARIVATTCANLDAAVLAGVFSRELQEALSVHTLDIPPLRARRSDIPALARHFLALEEPRRRFDWSATFVEKLLLYDWPMNARELRTLMRRLTLVEEQVTTLRSAHLPKHIRRRVRMPTEDQLRASAIQVQMVPSRAELKKMLEQHRGDVQRVADHYAKDRRLVYRWIARHDLSVGDYRD